MMMFKWSSSLQNEGVVQQQYSIKRKFIVVFNDKNTMSTFYESRYLGVGRNSRKYGITVMFTLNSSTSYNNQSVTKTNFQEVKK